MNLPLQACCLISVLIGNASLAGGSEPFCNPLDLTLDVSKGWRHAADPAVVFYQNKWWLFTTWDFDGYRVSDDLVNWRDVRFDPAIRRLALDKNCEYCGAAVCVFDGAMLFLAMHQPETKGRTPVLRTRDPLSGKWEKCGEIPAVQDPALFADGGRLFLYHGLGEGAPTRVMELDTKSFTLIPGTEKELRPRVKETGDLTGGIELGRREIFDETDTSAFPGKLHKLPCQEGSWMTKANGRYYLNYATPGTLTQWYSDVVLEGATPTGPFRPMDYSPAAMMAGGFIGSAGHGCFFQDRHGNWLRMGTMWIGVHNAFERRVGMFPAGFDSKGRMFTDTAFGDYPQFLPETQGSVRNPQDAVPRWMLVSEQAVGSASSESPGHGAAQASDENVRTWWAAASGRKDEWWAMDLGETRTIHTVQVNLAEQDPKTAAKAPATDGQKFTLLTSDDGTSWKTVWDRSSLEQPSAHPLKTFDPPLVARHLRVVNAADSAAGAFALREVRAFGKGNGHAPEAVHTLVARRLTEDEHFATFTWDASPRADGYVLRFGVAPDALHLAIRIQVGTTSSFTTHVLNRGVGYHFRLDAFNENGVTPGTLSSLK